MVTVRQLPTLNDSRGMFVHTRAASMADARITAQRRTR
jgi:hypothetical protein